MSAKAGKPTLSDGLGLLAYFTQRLAKKLSSSLIMPASGFERAYSSRSGSNLKATSTLFIQSKVLGLRHGGTSTQCITPLLA